MGYQNQPVLRVHAIGVGLGKTNDALLVANEVITHLRLAPYLLGGHLHLVRRQGSRPSDSSPVSFSQLPQRSQHVGLFQLATGP